MYGIFDLKTTYNLDILQNNRLWLGHSSNNIFSLNRVNTKVIDVTASWNSDIFRNLIRMIYPFRSLDYVLRNRKHINWNISITSRTPVPFDIFQTRIFLTFITKLVNIFFQKYNNIINTNISPHSRKYYGKAHSHLYPCISSNYAKFYHRTHIRKLVVR